MPNWCSNKIDFIGSEEDILSFRESMIETKSAQDLASGRAMVMLVQETLEPGTLKEFNLAILRLKMNENAPIDKQLFDTINHLWNDFDVEKISPLFDAVWKEISVDWSLRLTDRSLEVFLEHLGKDIPYEIKVEDTCFDFAQFIPLPFMSSLLGFNSKTEQWLEGYVKDLPLNKYETQSRIWGTKWNACQVSLAKEQVEGGFSLYFATAWSPPITIFEAVAKKYPNLILDVSFSEPGNNYCGRYIWKVGDLILELEDEMEWIEDEEGDQVEIIEPDWMHEPLKKLIKIAGGTK